MAAGVAELRERGAGSAPSPTSRPCSGLPRERRDRQQVVQPRPAGRRPPAALRRRRLGHAASSSPSRGGRRARWPARSSRTGVWDQPGVTAASRFETPLDEYVAWVEANSIEASSATRTTSSTRWPSSASAACGRSAASSGSTSPASTSLRRRRRYDVIYSVTQCEQERYRGWGLETPRVPWGIHPELLGRRAEARSDDGIVAIRLPRRLPRAPQAGRAGHRGLLADDRPEPAADRQGPGRALAP